MRGDSATFAVALLLPFALGFAPSTPRSAFVATRVGGRIGAVPTSSGRMPQSTTSTVVRAARQESTVLDKDETAVNGVGKAQLVALESTDATAAVDDELCVVKDEEELSETQKLMQQVKDAGVAGVISYALWELGFWLLSVPVVIFGYNAAVGHFPDLSDKDDLAKLGAEAFAFVNFARFAVPLRIGLALSTTPWIQNNIVDKYMKKTTDDDCEEPDLSNESALNGSDDVIIEAATSPDATAERKVPRRRSFLPFGRRKSD